MRDKIVAGNWKMNGDKDQINSLLGGLLQQMPENGKAAVIVFPPAIYLPQVAERLKGSAISWGGQNLYPAEKGAYTGEISGPMLAEYGCRYVLVGHSERRQLFHESEKFVAEKFHHVKEHDMIPVLCVGETLAEREAGLTHEVIARQLAAVANREEGSFAKAVVAYEPVWAIGTGKTATPEQAQEAHQFIRAFVAELSETEAMRLPILYGGSVNEKNAGALFAMPDIDGGLVGGASLNAEQFVEIVKCIN